MMDFLIFLQTPFSSKHPRLVFFIWMRHACKKAIIIFLIIYIKRGNASACNASACDGLSCAQPSLVADGRKLIFIKTAQTH